MTISTTRNLTIVGIITIIQALAFAASAFFDGDPATNPDFGLLISSIIAGVGMIMAKGAQSTGGTVDAAGQPVP